MPDCTDGIYVLRTTVTGGELGRGEVVSSYKALAQVERAFRAFNTDLDIRPIRHRAQDPVRAHVFLRMLSYYITWHMQDRLAQRNARSMPRARPGSTTTRSVPGGPGTPASPYPCSPWPGWRPARRRPEKGGRYQRPRRDRLHLAGDPPPADQPGPGLLTRP